MSDQSIIDRLNDEIVDLKAIAQISLDNFHNTKDTLSAKIKTLEEFILANGKCCNMHPQIMEMCGECVFCKLDESNQLTIEDFENSEHVEAGLNDAFNK